MRKFIAVFFAFSLICYPVLSSAQSKQPATPDKWDIFGGYSFSRASVVDETPFPLDLNGGQASGTFYFTRHFGATAEFAGYTDDTDETTFNTQGYLFGPSGRFGLPHGKYPRVTFFAHQLFGVTHLSWKADSSEDCTGDCSITTNSFTMVSGGGVDIKLTKHLSIRPAQMEYFNEQISLGALFSDEPGARPGAKPLESEEDLLDSIKISANGFRYSAGAVFHF